MTLVVIIVVLCLVMMCKWINCLWHLSMMDCSEVIGMHTLFGSHFLEATPTFD